MRKREKKEEENTTASLNQTVKYLMENSVHLIPLSDLPSWLAGWNSYGE